MNSKTMEYFDVENDGLTYYPDLAAVPETVLKSIYTSPDIFSIVIEERSRLLNKQRLRVSNIFAPLSIYSNLSLDLFFEQVVIKHDLAAIINNHKGWLQLDSVVTQILIDLELKHPQIFTRYFISSVKNNFRITQRFNDWFLQRQDYESLDRLMLMFIDMIGFPFSLN